MSGNLTINGTLSPGNSTETLGPLLDTSAQIIIVLWICAWFTFMIRTFMVRVFEVKILTFRIRSELFFVVLWVLLPSIFLPALGEIKELFIWVKYYSVALSLLVITFHKYFSGFSDPPGKPRGLVIGWVSSTLLAVLLTVNIMEAVIWETITLGSGPYNYINGISGLILAFGPFLQAYQYGIDITEEIVDEDDPKRFRVRQLRCNLTFSYILAYTIWNVEYTAIYTPDRAVYIIVASLAVPIFCAALLHWDWRECRATSLLHVIVLPYLPGASKVAAETTFHLGEKELSTLGFKYTMSILAAITTIIWAVEIVLILAKKHRPFLENVLPKGSFSISPDYPVDSLKVLVDHLRGKEIERPVEPSSNSDKTSEDLESAKAEDKKKSNKDKDKDEELKEDVDYEKLHS